MRSIQEQGKFAGSRAPYGYVRDPRDKHMLLADDETAPIVREMFEMVADGATLHYVATTLNERGVASPGRRLYETGVSKKISIRIPCGICRPFAGSYRIEYILAGWLVASMPLNSILPVKRK